MSDYVIEKGIPRPPCGLTAVLRSMEVGDSVYVPRPSHAQSTASRLQRLTGRQFTTKGVKGGVRIWRIS